MTDSQTAAAKILIMFQEVESVLVGKRVARFNGDFGTVNALHLDEEHGLRFSIEGLPGKWPVSTIKVVMI